MGIRDRPISPGSPWQNGIAARLIGTIRHECLDRILIFGELQLRRVLASYAAYYNQTRTHLALQKDAPLRRAVQRYGQIVTIPIVRTSSSICADVIFGRDRLDRQKLADRFPPRIRARELWRVAPEFIEEAQDDATTIAIRDQERAGMVTFRHETTRAIDGTF